MANFNQLVEFLESSGAFDVALPFLLVFTLSFAVFEKSGILGGKRNLNTIVSLVLALLFIRDVELVALVNRFLPNVSMFLVIILMTLLLIGIFAGKQSEWKGVMLAFGVLVSIAFIILALTSDLLGNKFNLPSQITDLDSQTKSTIIFVAIFFIIIYLIARDDKKDKKRFVDWVKERMEEIK